MDFEWTDGERETRSRVAAALAEIGPDRIEQIETAGLEELERLVRDMQSVLARAGLLGLALAPEERADQLRLMAGQLEVARASGSLFLSVETTARLLGGLLASAGERALREELLPRLVRGELVGAVAISEPPETEDGCPAGLVARPDGGEWLLSGAKSFATNAPIADLLALSARDPEGRLVVAFVDAGHPGLEVGPRLATLGHRGLAVAALELDRVRLPAARVAGPFDGPGPLERLEVVEGLVLAVASVGLMERCLEAARAHAKAHRRGGRPVGHRQEVAFKLAEMLTLTQTAELLAYRAGWLHGAGDPEARAVVRCARVFTAESAERVASMAMQILAGQGYLFGNAVERSYREARYAPIVGPTSELTRMAIAEDVLARYRG